MKEGQKRDKRNETRWDSKKSVKIKKYRKRRNNIRNKTSQRKNELEKYSI